VSIQHPITLVAGATASGKTALALSLAKETGGEIVGVDSMQIYRDLPILTAAPTAAEQAEVPHHLVGVADAKKAWSVGVWLERVKPVLADLAARGKPPILVGGTGLYFRALTHGLADIPPVDRSASEHLTEAALRGVLGRLDPVSEERIRQGDRQRLIRAHAVATQTGKSLTDWHAATGPALEPGSWRAMVVELDRAELYARCDARFAAMIEAGVLDEVAKLAARNLRPDRPALKAVGYAELVAHLRGETSLDEAIHLAQQETRRYAKRQLTWLRNQTPDWERVGAS